VLYIKQDLTLLHVKDQLFDGYVTVRSDVEPNRVLICVVTYDKGKEVRNITFDQQGIGQVYFKITEDIVKSKKITLAVGIFNYEDYTYSNQVEVQLDPAAVVRIKKDEDEFKNIHFELYELKQRLLDFMIGVENKPEIPQANKEDIKKGMVLTVIDDEGHVAYRSPYTDTIKEINGLKGFNYKVDIHSKDIPYQTINVEDALKNLSQSFKAFQANYENLLATTQEVIKKLAELEVKFVEYTSRDIL
jgi:hypothetical protein